MPKARSTFLILFLLSFFVLAPFVIAQASQDTLAFERAQHIRRGINASIWFAQFPSDYSVKRLQSFTTPDDIALMSAMGLDHVRLSIDADPLVDWMRHRGETTPFVTELDRVVKAILDNHLSVLIDIHPESSYKAPLKQGSASVEQFNSLWRVLAAHYASTDPEHVFFEIMNEPEQDDPFRWQGIESTVAQTIRTQAPNHTIIAAGAHWSGLGDLLVLQPLGLPNVIYTFHDYEPFPFTHQGATWTTPAVRPLRGIPYPSSPADIASKLSQEPDLAGQFFLDEYGMGKWDAARVEHTIAYAAKWSQLHHVPVYCGEFGVLRDYANPAMRAQWTHDMRVAFEKNNIGWAMWDYQTNFGLVSKENGGAAKPIPAMVEALGLRQPKQ